jgi:hypothetical protein
MKVPAMRSRSESADVVSGSKEGLARREPGAPSEDVFKVDEMRCWVVSEAVHFIPEPVLFIR